MKERFLIASLLIVSVIAPGWAVAASSTNGPTPRVGVQLNGTVLSMPMATSYESAVVRISGPGGYALVKRIAKNAPLSVDLATGRQMQSVSQDSREPKTGDFSGRKALSPKLPDGEYHYEVRTTDLSGKAATQAGVFFVEAGRAISRQAKRVDLASVRQSLESSPGVFGNHTEALSGGPSPKSYSTNDAITVFDASHDNYTVLALYGYTSDVWVLANYLDEMAIIDASTAQKTPLLDVTPSGYVGIGTTAPSDSLDVEGGLPQFRLENTYGDTADMGVGSKGLWIYDENGNPIAQFNHGAASGSLKVDPGGVGVGLGLFGSASSPLDVQGKNGSGVNTTIDGGSLVVTRGDSTPNIRFLKTAGTAQSWLFQNNSTSGVFAIRDETGGTSPVQIFPGAGAKLLQLQGTHVNVNGQIWQRGGVLHADYVFDPSYKLRSIADHAKYMWKHKHLPAIAGVERDAQGREMVNLGAQQRGIVEELEEAHIYIAQLNQRDERLSADLEETKGELKTERKTMQAELATTRAELEAERHTSRATETALQEEHKEDERTRLEVARLRAALQKLEEKVEKQQASAP